MKKIFSLTKTLCFLSTTTYSSNTPPTLDTALECPALRKMISHVIFPPGLTEPFDVTSIGRTFQIQQVSFEDGTDQHVSGTPALLDFVTKYGLGTTPFKNTDDNDELWQLNIQSPSPPYSLSITMRDITCDPNPYDEE